jgi:2,4-dienoyl-CoA reductase (NADPH2)
MPDPTTRHTRFRFRTVDQLRRKAEELGIDLPLASDVRGLFEPLHLGSRVVPNRIVVQPMEGRDAREDGAPSELTFRRYERFAAGGNGTIWFEAVAVSAAGAVHPRQLRLDSRTLPAFRQLVDRTRDAARPVPGGGPPLLVVQLAHGGRFAHREPGAPVAPVAVACPNPFLDPIDRTTRLWTDDELDAIGRDYVAAATLARQAGFDGVDIKACHGYLLHELLGAHLREESRFGGALANRARLLLEVLHQIRAADPSLMLAVRLNLTDGVPHPHGFGMARDGSAAPDESEACAVARLLAAEGAALLNITAGIPTYTPHLVRPFDRPARGGRLPEEHPLEGVARLLWAARTVARACPDLPVVASGLSWLRQFWPQVGAALLARGDCAAVGVGRGAFAYPDAARDLWDGGELIPGKCCTTCSQCTDRMRAGLATGCVVRDAEVYGPRHGLATG